MMRLGVKFLSIIMASCLIFCSCKSEQKNDESALFKKLSPTDTKINFANTITETKDFNILDYLYFYNGGGVSAGDINNDGLTDLFFVSNQGKNKLYLNKGIKNGVPQFEDISAKAGIEGHADWKTGVTMADINGDGLLDIYVCAVGKYKNLKGSNELYINNGNLTFSEKSKEYGLDFSGFSTQTAFFDYDNDGDLDCFLLNHAVHNIRSFVPVSSRSEIDKKAGDYLYRNDNGKFIDVTQQSGIYQAAMGYGLGISVADLNNDGWLDIYVSNDFHEDDYYYINQKNGNGSSPQFKEEVREHFKHLSRFSMGSDIADINNDGYQDIMTLDMAPEDEKVEKSSASEDALEVYLYKLQFGYYNQYSRNCLQLNMGGKKFSDIAPMAGVMSTDWSWSTLLADYDGDGIKDIFISNGILRRPNDLDYLKFVEQGQEALQNNMVTPPKLDREAIDKMPNGKCHNYLFKGTKELRFHDKSMVWGFEENNISNGSAYADLDNDGDLDLITNNLNEPAGIYLNNSRQLLKNNYLKVKLKGNDKNTFGIGAKVILKSKEGEQLMQLMPTRGFMSSVEPTLLFGIGKQTQIDTLIVVWGNQKMEVIKNPKINATLVLDESNAKVSNFQLFPKPEAMFEDVTTSTKIPFIHKENTYFDFNRESLMPFKVSTEGPKIAVGDVNGDGLEDFYVGGARFQAGELYLQKGNSFVASPQAAFKADSLLEDVDALFFDADGDKDLDLYVVSGGNEYSGNAPQLLDRLYINDGKGNFMKSTDALPQFFGNKSCVKACDFDKDGDLDLFVGGRVVAFNYGKSPHSYILVNNGHGNGSSPRFTDLTAKIAPEVQEIGMVTDAIWADIDKDGDQDLTIVGDWMPIKMFENDKGKLKVIDNKLGDFTGFWNGIAAGDFDKDGDIDFVVGNLGTNTKFRKEAEGSKLKMLIKDVDNNGTKEQILAYNRGKNWYPVNGKDELGKQMPSIINKKYTEYKQFAGKTIDELFAKKELDGAEEKLVNTYESVYIENLGNKTFKMTPLPSLAQVSKIMAIRAEDVDNDGNLDVTLGGNFNGTSMYQAQYDALYGLILKGNGKGNGSSPRFVASVPTDNGFLMEGNVRDIKVLNTPKYKLYLVARNNDKIQIFRKLK